MHCNARAYAPLKGLDFFHPSPCNLDSISSSLPPLSIIPNLCVRVWCLCDPDVVYYGSKKRVGIGKWALDWGYHGFVDWQSVFREGCGVNPLHGEGA